LYHGDLSNSEQIANMIYNIKPDEIYHLGAQSHVRVSFDLVEYTGDITGLGTARILEAVRKCGNKIKFYQASSSEMFGTASSPRNEKTAIKPRSPYACAKAYAYWMVKNYREGYKIFASNGILFNHESPRRGETFVTRKITRGLVAILNKKEKYLYLGNLNAKRDWGYAPEYIEAMWKILQQDKPDDFVLGTGKAHSVKDFLKEAFAYVGLNWKKYVKIDTRYFRPTEVEQLTADASKAKRILNWQPQISFSDLAKIMVDADMRSFGHKPPGEGDRILKDKFPKRWWKID
jgi:GDPmannose 4,6-dehydratase